MKITALALSLPSTIFFSGWFLMKLADEGYFSKNIAILLFLAIIGNTLALMVIYAYKNKN
jgi:hypothetical protein